MVGDGWQWLAVGGWSPLAVGSGWRLAAVGGPGSGAATSGGIRCARALMPLTQRGLVAHSCVRVPCVTALQGGRGGRQLGGVSEDCQGKLRGLRGGQELLGVLRGVRVSDGAHRGTRVSLEQTGRWWGPDTWLHRRGQRVWARNESGGRGGGGGGGSGYPSGFRSRGTSGFECWVPHTRDERPLRGLGGRYVGDVISVCVMAVSP